MGPSLYHNRRGSGNYLFYVFFTGIVISLEDGEGLMASNRHDALVIPAFPHLARDEGMADIKVQEIPRQPWYYLRIVTWVAADSFLPLERDYYAPSKRLWKIERFEEIKRIDGVPTPLWITMEDLRDGSSSTLEVSDVRYDTNVPDTLFDPGRLPEAVASPVWQEPLRTMSQASDSATSTTSG